MNRKKWTFIAWGLILAGCLILPAIGWGMVLRVFSRCDHIVMEHSSHEALLAALKPEAVMLLFYSGMIVAGVGLCLILIVWISGRGHREIRML